MYKGKTEFVKKDRYTIPEYHDIELGKEYAISLNPCDKYQHFRSFKRPNEFMSDTSHIRECIPHCRLYVEISKKGRLHYHGYMMIETEEELNEFYTYSIPKMISAGTICIKNIDDEKIWKDYCLKQAKYHKYIKMVTFQPIPYKRGSYINN